MRAQVSREAPQGRHWREARCRPCGAWGFAGPGIRGLTPPANQFRRFAAGCRCAPGYAVGYSTHRHTLSLARSHSPSQRGRLWEGCDKLLTNGSKRDRLVGWQCSLTSCCGTVGRKGLEWDLRRPEECAGAGWVLINLGGKSTSWGPLYPAGLLINPAGLSTPSWPRAIEPVDVSVR